MDSDDDSDDDDVEMAVERQARLLDQQNIVDAKLAQEEQERALQPKAGDRFDLSLAHRGTL